MTRIRVTPDMTPEKPPSIMQSTQVVDWEEVVDALKENPGQWMRINAQYANYHSTRVSVWKAASRWGFQQRVIKDGDGAIVYVMWPHRKGAL